jgi:hypothetical protein
VLARILGRGINSRLTKGSPRPFENKAKGLHVAGHGVYKVAIKVINMEVFGCLYIQWVYVYIKKEMGAFIWKGNHDFL